MKTPNTIINLEDIGKMYNDDTELLTLLVKNGSAVFRKDYLRLCDALDKGNIQEVLTCLHIINSCFTNYPSPIAIQYVASLQEMAKIGNLEEVRKQLPDLKNILDEMSREIECYYSNFSKK